MIFVITFLHISLVTINEYMKESLYISIMNAILNHYLWFKQSFWYFFWIELFTLFTFSNYLGIWICVKLFLNFWIVRCQKWMRSPVNSVSFIASTTLQLYRFICTTLFVTVQYIYKLKYLLHNYVLIYRYNNNSLSNYYIL